MYFYTSLLQIPLPHFILTAVSLSNIIIHCKKMKLRTLLNKLSYFNHNINFNKAKQYFSEGFPDQCYVFKNFVNYFSFFIDI